MAVDIDETGPPARSHGTTRLLCAVLALGGLAGGCGGGNAANETVQHVEGAKAIIDAITAKLRAGDGSTYEATYVSTGGPHATIVYAVDPPKGIAFTQTPSVGNAGVHVIVNPSGEFSCSPSAARSRTWSCRKLDIAAATVEKQVYTFYTPAHWVIFLRDFSLAAPLPGDKVTASSKAANGFHMQCVDVRAAGVPGTSTICSTAQGIPGYVSVATNATGFEIERYSRSPASSLFTTPGATITPPPA